MKNISIIIVSYNVKYYIEQCLHSIFRTEGMDLKDIEVFVVDNSSKDNTVSFLRQRFPQKTFPNVHIIANKRNVGFGRANNQAVRQAKGKYILFLNPDTLLTEHTLRDAFAEAERHDDLGALGVKMLHTNGRFAPESRRGVPSPWTAFCKMSGLNRLFPTSRLFGRYYMRNISKEQVAPVDIVSGAFMLIPSDVLKHTGNFDEDFFMYGEDIDLSFRILKSGHQNYYAPVTILHYKGESTRKNSFHYVHVFYEAMFIFFRKHYQHYTFAFSLIVKSAIVLSALLSLLAQQLLSLRKFLYPRAFHKNQRMLYLGHAAEAISQLAEDYGLDIDCIDTDQGNMPYGYFETPGAEKSKYVHIVYDTADFTTERILNIFEYHNAGGSHIGTFCASNGTLITGSSVYTLDD